jgi:myosin heavy subunit
LIDTRRASRESSSSAPTGFPIRLQHHEFLLRYACTVRGSARVKTAAGADFKAECRVLLSALRDFDGTLYQIGCTRVFLRKGEAEVAVCL